MITAEKLRETLDYNPETGVFIWRKGRRKVKGGTIAGSQKKYETVTYITIRIDQKLYLAHRLAWLYVHGVWPTEHIDHKDLNGLNNAISNLREATHRQNQYNRGMYRNNTTGFKGVYRVTGQPNKWEAKIQADGQTVSLGRFRTPEEAHAAYSAAATKYHGEFGRPA